MMGGDIALFPQCALFPNTRGGQPYEISDRKSLSPDARVARARNLRGFGARNAHFRPDFVNNIYGAASGAVIVCCVCVFVFNGLGVANLLNDVATSAFDSSELAGYSAEFLEWARTPRWPADRDSVYVRVVCFGWRRCRSWWCACAEQRRPVGKRTIGVAFVWFWVFVEGMQMRITAKKLLEFVG